jgi:hypothetical protein
MASSKKTAKSKTKKPAAKANKPAAKATKPAAKAKPVAKKTKKSAAKPKPAARTAAAKPAARSAAAKPAARSAAEPERAMLLAAVPAPAPAGDPACPLPPKAKSHVVMLDGDAQVGDRVMCENNHLLVVTQLAPPVFAKA